MFCGKYKKKKQNTKKSEEKQRNEEGETNKKTRRDAKIQWKYADWKKRKGWRKIKKYLWKTGKWYVKLFQKNSCRETAEQFKIDKTQAANVVKNETSLRAEYRNFQGKGFKHLKRKSHQKYKAINTILY